MTRRTHPPSSHFSSTRMATAQTGPPGPVTACRKEPRKERMHATHYCETTQPNLIIIKQNQAKPTKSSYISSSFQRLYRRCPAVVTYQCGFYVACVTRRLARLETYMSMSCYRPAPPAAPHVVHGGLRLPAQGPARHGPAWHGMERRVRTIQAVVACGACSYWLRSGAVLWKLPAANNGPTQMFGNIDETVRASIRAVRALPTPHRILPR